MVTPHGMWSKIRARTAIFTSGNKSRDIEVFVSLCLLQSPLAMSPCVCVCVCLFARPDGTYGPPFKMVSSILSTLAGLGSSTTCFLLTAYLEDKMLVVPASSNASCGEAVLGSSGRRTVR